MSKVFQAGFQACNSSTDHDQPEKFLMLQMNVGLHSCSTRNQFYLFIYFCNAILLKAQETQPKYTDSIQEKMSNNIRNKEKEQAPVTDYFNNKAKKEDDNVDLI
jgi:hypothetical protein